MTTLAMSNLNAGSYVPEQRYAGETDIITKPQVIAAGSGAVAARTVLGRVTASGKLVPHNPGASDGSQTAVAILVDAVNAAADVTAAVYIAGEFNMDALVYNAATNTDALKLGLFGVNGPIVIRKLAYSGG
jgi:hypothetical protein